MESKVTAELELKNDKFNRRLDRSIQKVRRLNSELQRTIDLLQKVKIEGSQLDINL